MKFTSNKGELTLNKTPNITLARFDSQTYRKWNRILASISCILIFLLLLGIVVRSIWNERHNQNCTSTFQLLNYGQSNKCSLSANERECTIKCLQLYDFDDLNILLKNSENQMKTCQLSIQIDDSRNLNIIQNWLPSDNNNINLNQIEFYRSSINIIDTNAFVGLLFETIKKIEFKSDTTIKLIKENSFSTQRLNELNFQDSQVIQIEPGYASSFNHLHTLQYIRCSSDPKILENLTISTKFPQLATLDLRFANNWVLEQKIFENLKELQLVHFEDSNIMSIGPKTFAKNTKLSQLNLKNTNLKYISENIFGSNKSLIKLLLSENQWICNCSLQWLKDTWMTTDYQTENFPICDKPDEYQGLSFNEVDFCSSEIVSPTPTPEPTTTDENEDIPDVVTVLCSNDGEIHIGDNQLHSRIEENLKKREIIDFDVFESNGDVIVKLDRILEDYCLLWTNNNRELIFDNNNVIDKRNGTGCFTRVNETNIMKLEPENFYTICLINGTNKEVGTLISPFDCKAIKISLFHKRYFLWIIITIVITIVFLLSLIIIFIIYKRKFSIRKRKPKQIDTLNRIIHHDDAHNVHVDWPFPTNNIDTVSCALDRSTTFSMPRSQNRGRRRLERSLSESSFYSHGTIRSGETGSYVSPPEPSALELLNWKMACIREKYFKEQESPPPLPPYPVQKSEMNLDKSNYHSQDISSSTSIYSYHK